MPQPTPTTSGPDICTHPDAAFRTSRSALRISPFLPNRGAAGVVVGGLLVSVGQAQRSVVAVESAEEGDAARLLAVRGRRRLVLFALRRVKGVGDTDAGVAG